MKNLNNLFYDINKMFNQYIVQGLTAAVMGPKMMEEFPEGEDSLKINGSKLLASTDRVLPLISGHSIDKIFTLNYTLNS
jgi:hypothetical protein